MDQFSPKASPLQQHHRAQPSSNNPGGPPPPDASSLKMTISLKHKAPFYLMRSDHQSINSETTGATNLMAARGLEHSYQKLTMKKIKDSLSSFLPNLPGVIDASGAEDNSTLRGIIEKPPVGGKELVPLNQVQLSGFRLHPGPLPEQYRALSHVQTKRKKAKKHKRERQEMASDSGAGAGSLGTDNGVQGVSGLSGFGGGSSGATSERTDEEREKRREKKHKKHDKDAEERKKKKKEKKKKRKEEKD